VRGGLPAEFLVGAERQPDFVWSAEEAAWSSLNIGRATIDVHVAAGAGEREAVVCLETGERCTYAELKDSSDRLAGALVELGLRPGDRLALRYASRPQALIAALAAWKAGGAVVPIPAQARTSEIEFYLQDTGARFVVVLGEGDFIGQLEPALAASSVEDVIVGGAAAGPHHDLEDLLREGDPAAARGVETVADDLATVWHTGGTTGRPKATYHTHRRWLAAGRRLAAGWGISAQDRWLLGIPVGNVAGFLSRFIVPLQHGATLIEPADLSGPGVLRAIEAEAVTRLLGIPVTLDSLAGLAAASPASIRSLREVLAPFLVTGAGDLYDRWRELGYPLGNPLGSSVMCQWFIGPRAGEQTPPFALGRPVPGYEIRIVDDAGASAQPLPVGQVGRIAARGPTGLTYWNRHQIQEAEVLDGWTITDDLARVDEDGFLWFLGRLNNLVVTAGYKVAPGEVEQALLQHPAVREVAVVGLPDALREQVVAAFVVPALGEGDERLAEELQAWCKERLAPYKYPRRVFFRASLPRDPVGKVQVRQLADSVGAG